MEPLDSDMEYMVRTSPPSAPVSRFDIMLILPVLGLILLLVFVGAAIFGWNLSDLIGSLMGFMMLFFGLMIFLFFWALAPGSRKR